MVYNELKNALKSLVLENDLHLVYLVTPMYVNIEPPWRRYFELYESLPEITKRIGACVGVREGFLARAMQGRVPEYDDKQKQVCQVICKSFVSQLNDTGHTGSCCSS